MKKVFFLLLFFSSLFLFSVRNDQVSAAGEATNQLPADNTFIVVSADGAAAGSFSSPISTNHWYVPADSRNERVEIGNIDNGTLSFLEVGWVDGAGTCRDQSSYQEVNPGNRSFINVDPGRYTIPQVQTKVINNVTFKVLCVTVTVTVPSTGSVTFKLYSTLGTYLGAYAGSNTSKGTGYFASNGQIWNQTVSFAPPCGADVPVNGNYIQLYDLDNGYSQNSVQVSLIRYNRNTGAYISSDTLSQNPDGDTYDDVFFANSNFGANTYNTAGDNSDPWNNNWTWHIAPESGTYLQDSRYELRILGMGRNNKIRVRLPFDQINSINSCGNVETDCTNGGTTICPATAPTCDAQPAIIALVGDSFTTSATIRNNAPTGVDIRSVTYSGPGGISGSPNTGSPDIAASPATLSHDGSHTLSSATSGSIQWTIVYRDVNGIEGTLTCSQPITVSNRPPTCEVLAIVPIRPQIGQQFKTRVRVTNPNSVPITIQSAAYSLQDITASGSNFTGNATVELPQTLGAGDGVEYESNQNIIVSAQALNFNIEWIIGSDTGSSAPCRRPNTDDGLFDIFLRPPVCIVTLTNHVVGVPFTISVSVTNPNKNAPLLLLNTGQEYVISDGQSGDADPDGGWDPASGFSSRRLESGSTTLFSSVPPLGIRITESGQYKVNWSINSEAGLAGGNCADMGVPDGPGGPGDPSDPDNPGGGVGPDEPALQLDSQPFVRFYGNDVFAGGGYGTNCTTGDSVSARGFGFFEPAQQIHANYSGSAAELAIFAIGQIQGVLAGAEDRTRTSLSALSFANTDLGNGELSFAGNFGNPLCVDDYWAQAPDSPDALPPLASNVLDVSTLDSGTYTYGSDLYIIGNAPIQHGIRITLYVNGDLWLGDSSYVDGQTQSLTYAAGPWATIADIPMLKIIVLGNIYVDNNINQLDGMYVAVEDRSPSAIGQSGEIYTCALSEQTRSFLSPFGPEIATACQQERLVVNGAFIAKKVHLIRTLGNIWGSPAAESAEEFRFSPELYLSLLAAGSNENEGQFDSIQSLPPSL